MDNTSYFPAGDSPDDLAHTAGSSRPDPGELDYPAIPQDLEYLIAPAAHYGREYQFSDTVQWFLENAEDSDVATLATLAERARLASDYPRVMEWMDEVDDVLEAVIDQRQPYRIRVSEEQRKDYLSLVNPALSERQKQRAIRMSAEAADRSDTVTRRREMRGRLVEEANNRVHHMDVYFLFGLMDACDLDFGG
ncbi:MAG: hypothetical protein U1E05_00915 [Patescibacteria group bacterium]|nr:hypothetical protein [Patescibacteria group bacterium]